MAFTTRSIKKAMCASVGLCQFVWDSKILISVFNMVQFRSSKICLKVCRPNGDIKYDFSISQEIKI